MNIKEKGLTVWIQLILFYPLCETALAANQTGIWNT